MHRARLLQTTSRLLFSPSSRKVVGEGGGELAGCSEAVSGKLLDRSKTDLFQLRRNVASWGTLPGRYWSPMADTANDRIHILTGEGATSREGFIEDDPQAEDISRRRHLIGMLNLLWCHVRGASTDPLFAHLSSARPEERRLAVLTGLRLKDSGNPPVDDQDLTVTPKQDVRWLEISVNHTKRVGISDPMTRLL